MIFLIFLAMAPFSCVFGSISTYITGRMMQLDELTYWNSLRLNLITSFLWYVPVIALFLFEWYVGSGRILPWLSPEPRFWIVMAGAQISMTVLWLLLTMYVFGWHVGQSCLFGCANGCVSYALYMLMQIGIYALLILIGFLISQAMDSSGSP